jgi:hypothetical protein
MLPRLTNEFEIDHVGIATPVSEDRATLLQAAFERLADAANAERERESMSV